MGKIEGRTSAELTEVASGIAADTARRDRLIVKRRDQGASLRTIAAEAGMVHGNVEKIIKRQAAATNGN